MFSKYAGNSGETDDENEYEKSGGDGIPFTDPEDEMELNALETLENNNYNKDGFLPLSGIAGAALARSRQNVDSDYGAPASNDQTYADERYMKSKNARCRSSHRLIMNTKISNLYSYDTREDQRGDTDSDVAVRNQFLEPIRPQPQRLASNKTYNTYENEQGPGSVASGSGGGGGRSDVRLEPIKLRAPPPREPIYSTRPESQIQSAQALKQKQLNDPNLMRMKQLQERQQKIVQMQLQNQTSNNNPNRPRNPNNNSNF